MSPAVFKPSIPAIEQPLKLEHILLVFYVYVFLFVLKNMLLVLNMEHIYHDYVECSVGESA
jgi:hypothetical protein